jgi:aspartyl protease family protein
LALLLGLGAAQAAGTAEDPIQVLAVMGNAALVRIGEEERVMRPGDTAPGGIEMLGAHAGGARFRIRGREEFVPRGVVLASLRPDAEEVPQISLWANSDGFFLVHGLINGMAARLLVDTGASDVTLNSGDADRLGLAYRDGRRLGVVTASGKAIAHEVVAREIRLGPIRVQQVPVLVIEGGYPKIPLLGMSFLGRLRMSREGARMDLTQQF